MGFHDDGEVGLGPVVTSLSLGGDAFMFFRRKIPPVRGEKKKSRGKGVQDACLKLLLRHGDVCIMEVCCDELFLPASVKLRADG